jgi:hypothetical protein
MFAGKMAMSKTMMLQAASFLEKDGSNNKAQTISMAPLTKTNSSEKGSHEGIIFI